MNVICINDAHWGIRIHGFFKTYIEITIGPQYGDIDEVVSQIKQKGKIKQFNMPALIMLLVFLFGSQF